MAPAHVKICGIPIDNLSLKNSADKIIEIAQQRKYDCAFAVTPNAQHVVLLKKKGEFGDAYTNAGFRFADGVPLVWVSKIKRTPLAGRVNGTDLFETICRSASEKDLTIFLFGGRPGSAEACKDVLSYRHPDLNISGIYCPPFGFEHDDLENQKAISAINRVKPDILFIGLGSPKQEVWINKYRQTLRTSIAVCIGASFELVSGAVRRAPAWMQRSGFEWLYRLFKEPRRLIYRYTVVNSEFIVRAMADVMTSRTHR